MRSCSRRRPAWIESRSVPMLPERPVLVIVKQAVVVCPCMLQTSEREREREKGGGHDRHGDAAVRRCNVLWDGSSSKRGCQRMRRGAAARSRGAAAAAPVTSVMTWIGILFLVGESA